MWQISTHQPVGGTDFETQHTVSQSLIVTLHTNICKLSLENHFLDLDVNGNVLLDTGLKELVRHMIVSTEFRWVVFGCCGVVL
jgi:hypothetical protein